MQSPRYVMGRQAPKLCSLARMLGLPSRSPFFTSYLSPCTSDIVVSSSDIKSIRSRVRGRMHYNPASAALASSTIQREAAGDGVQAVLVELCPARWNLTAAREYNATAAATRPPSLKRWLTDDEFVVSFRALRACAPELPFEQFILGDQPIADTLRRTAELAGASARDLVRGPSGWRTLFDEVREAAAQLAGPANKALLEPRLLLGVPVAMLRGPVSSPALGVLLLGLGTLAPILVDAVEHDTSVISPAERLLEVLLVVAVAATALRVGLVGLIAERNRVLAENIRAACEAATDGDAADGDAAVVAIMGLAHVNGVRRLVEQETSDSELRGPPAPTAGRATEGSS